MPIGSDSPLVLDLALISEGIAVPIPPQDYFVSMTLETGNDGSWTASVELFDYQGDFLENLLLIAGLDRSLRVTFGRGPAFPYDNLTVEGAISSYKPAFEEAGVRLTFELVATPVIRAFLDRRERSYAAGQRLSDVVEAIAADRGWLVEDADGRHTIEPTKGVTQRPFNTSGESDFTYIREQLVPQAVNEWNVGDYSFYVDTQNVVHFHSPNFLAPVEVSYTYMRDGAGNVLSWSVTDVSVFAVGQGGGNSWFSAYDSAAGAKTQIKSTTIGGVSLDGSELPADWETRPDFGETTHSDIRFIARDADELRRLAQVRYDRMRKLGYRSELEVVGSHAVRPNDYINVRYIKSNPAAGAPIEHYLSGRFMVTRLKHDISGGAWKTTYTMLRQGVQVPGAKPVVVSKTVEPKPVETK